MGALNSILQGFLDVLVNIATSSLMPLMVVAFFAGVALKLLVHYTVHRHAWFAKEVEKRTNTFLQDLGPHKPISFFRTVKKLLEKTYYEVFEVRSIMKRRDPDVLAAAADRVFLVQQGCAWFVHDLQKSLAHLKYDRVETQAKMLQLTRSSFQRNPAFNRLFGVIPAAPLNDLLNTLPQIFVISGIFGTFLGIVKALPELSGMDIGNTEQTKLIMDTFLLRLAFSMNSSILGIALSVAMTFINTTFNPDKVFSQAVERFEAVLDLLWHRSHDNDLPEVWNKFDENRDPLEVLAEKSVYRALHLDHEIQPTSEKKAS